MGAPSPPPAMFRSAAIIMCVHACVPSAPQTLLWVCVCRCKLLWMLDSESFALRRFSFTVDVFGDYDAKRPTLFVSGAPLRPCALRALRGLWGAVARSERGMAEARAESWHDGGRARGILVTFQPPSSPPPLLALLNARSTRSLCPSVRVCARARVCVCVCVCVRACVRVRVRMCVLSVLSVWSRVRAWPDFWLWEGEVAAELLRAIRAAHAPRAAADALLTAEAGCLHPLVPLVRACQPSTPAPLRSPPRRALSRVCL